MPVARSRRAGELLYRVKYGGKVVPLMSRCGSHVGRPERTCGEPGWVDITQSDYRNHRKHIYLGRRGGLLGASYNAPKQNEMAGCLHGPMLHWE